MANFDTNSWYQIIMGDSTVQSFDGSVLYDKGLYGAVFFQITNLKSNEQQWQLYPFNSSYYIMRTRGSGQFGYMGVAVSNNSVIAGNTVPGMMNASVADASSFWTIGPWEDGTFWMSNAANGSAWHLNVKGDSLTAMSSNITAPQAGQRFTFNQLGKIDDVRYSSVVTPAAAATSTSSSTYSSTSTSTMSSVPTKSTTASSGGGLSSGAQAAIGASIGVVALIVALLLGWFLIRRRRRRQAALKLNYLPPLTYQNEEQKKQMLPTYELQQPEVRHEMGSTQAEFPHELPAESNKRAVTGIPERATQVPYE